jgi:hypothetical protein
VAPLRAGLEVTLTLISNRRLAKRAHKGQSKVNVPFEWLKKAVFSGHKPFNTP